MPAAGQRSGVGEAGVLAGRVLRLTVLAMIIGGRPLAILDLALPRDAGTWTAVVYLAVAGSVVTFLSYFTLLKVWSVTTLSFISVFTPAIALLLGFVFLDERPTLLTGVGAVLILAGVGLALTGAKGS